MPPESVPDRPRLAILVAGGSGRRLGLVDKPALLLDGRRLLDIALAAVTPARTVVVGPERILPAGVLQTRETPPGGGPAAAVVAGLTALVPRSGDIGSADLVAVLAADLPGIDATAVDSLTAALHRVGGHGAVLIDPDGRNQYLAGVWRLAALDDAARSRPSWHGGRVADLLGPLISVRVPTTRRTAADIDTAADLLEWGISPNQGGDPGRPG